MNIGIVGLGVVGGSYAISLKEAGYEFVYGIDTNKNTLVTAKDMGIIKEGFTSGKEILGECDIVIISIYPDSIVKFLEDNKQYFKKDAIITDAVGIKGVIVERVENTLRDDVHFVFGHPMAGREKKGIEFASGAVFKGANYIITPTDRTDDSAIDVIEKLVSDIGFKKITKITPNDHDKIISFTSQLPHVLAVALINSDDESFDTGRFIGDSYRDLTRISNINGDLWAELFMNNKENLLYCIKNFEEQLDLIKDCINKEDNETLKEIFKKSSLRREQLE